MILLFAISKVIDYIHGHYLLGIVSAVMAFFMCIFTKYESRAFIALKEPATRLATDAPCEFIPASNKPKVEFRKRWSGTSNPLILAHLTNFKFSGLPKIICFWLCH